MPCKSPGMEWTAEGAQWAVSASVFLLASFAPIVTYTMLVPLKGSIRNL